MAQQAAGGFAKDPQSANSLFNVGLEFPSIYNALVTMDKKYTLQYIPDALSNIQEMPIGQQQHSWFVEGRREDPVYCTGVSSGTGAGNTPFTVEVTTNQMPPKFVMKFTSALQAETIDGGTPSAGGYTYTFIPMTTSTTAAIVAGDVAAGAQIGWGWPTFENKSKTGYGYLKYPDRYTNFTSIARASCSLDGTDATTATWIKNAAGENMVWFPKQYQRERDGFVYNREKKLWYATSNVNPVTGVCMSPDIDGNMLVQGDGYVNQIDAINIGTYTGQLNSTVLLDYIYAYIDNASIVADTEILCVTGTQGLKQFQNCMEQKYLYQGQYMKEYVTGGQKVALGGRFLKYTVANVTINVVVNPIKDDRLFNTAKNPDGFTKEANGFDFMCMDDGGSPNIIRKVKSAGGINRSMIEKQLPGMVNPMGAGAIAVTAVDGFEVQWLSEEMICVLNPKSCGRLLQN